MLPALADPGGTTRVRAAAPPAAQREPAALDAVLEAAVAGGTPGVVLQVEEVGETIYRGAAGLASIEQHTPVSTADRFRIYSITKAFTATVTLQLADEGVLTLEDSVTRWLDDPEVLAIPDVDQITIRQLLTHSSGIYDYAGDPSNEFFADAFFGPEADWSRVWTPQEVLAYADGDRQEPYFAPGQGVYYANTNYILLGLIIEAATGRSYGTELSDRILDPLGLDQTSLETGRALPADVVEGYQLIDGQTVNVSAVNLSWAWAAGGMISTVDDLARFERATFSGELVSPAAHEEMFAFPSRSWAGYQFGMGVYRREFANGPMIGMDGGGAGGNAIMLRQEDQDLTAIALVNSGTSEVYALIDEAITWALAQPR
jgi:D-alanyl-D-alanine carboxypeptidase